jgi:dipeptidyl aminopeptidase/acylaminoacyl peptidase
MGKPMKKSLVAVLFLFVFAACFLPVSAQEETNEPKVMTAEVAEALQSVRSVYLSPCGEWVIYSVSKPAVPGKDKYPSSEYRIMPFSGGEDRFFLSGDGSPSSLKWRPGKKQLTFLASRDGKRQIWALPLDGGEAFALTSNDTSISSYQWDKDGTKIAFLATEPENEAITKAKKAGRDMDVVEYAYNFTRLYVLDMESKETRAITPAEYQVWGFDWAPDGSQFLITASEEKTTDARYMFQHIYLVDAASGERTRLLDSQEGKLGDVVWSPDGKHIAWNGGTNISDPSAGSLYVYSMETGEAVNHTGDAIETVSGVEWLDNETLAYTTIEFQHSHLYTMKLDGSDKNELLGTGPVFRGVSFSDDGTRLATSASTPTHPSELFVAEAGKELQRRTFHNPHLKNFALGKQEIIEWETTDGWKIQGVLIYPVNYEEGKRYPLIVNPHGGPESSSMDSWSTSATSWGQIAAGKGYFLLRPNYRASTGRGVAFSKANHRDLGGREFEDVVDGVKHLVNIGLVDEKKVGCGGGSYGGFFSAHAATQYSEHFAAAVVFAGPSSQYSKIGTTDTTWENAYVHYDLHDWWNHHELIWEFSPVAYVNNCKTPTLICHGENDKRVPIGQAQELFRNIKAATDTPVQLVIYPRAGHGVRELAHRLDYAERSMLWFDKYVKGLDVDVTPVY